MTSNIFKCGDLERKVDGAWRKEFVVLEILKMNFCASAETQDKPVFTFIIAVVESMNTLDSGDKPFQFVLKSGKGDIDLAAPSKEERDEWVAALRSLIPKAKVLLSKRALAKKAKAAAAREQLQKSTRDSVDSLIAAGGRVVARSSFKIYADALCDRYTELLSVIDAMEAQDADSVKRCVEVVSAVVDASNSSAAICTNKALQGEIGVHAREIASDSANIVPLFVAATAGSKDTPEAETKAAKTVLAESLAELREAVSESRAFVRKSAELQEQLDAAKRDIEAMFEGESARQRPDGSVPIDKQVEEVEAHARALHEQMRQIGNTALLEPNKLGEQSKAMAAQMQKLLAEVNNVAWSCGIDPSAADPFANAGAIDEHKKQQLLSMLNAAKGFAAATSGVVDVLKQVPKQETDENLRHHLAAAISSSQTTLHSLVRSAQQVEPAGAAADEGGADATAPGADGGDEGGDVDAERALLDVLATLEKAAEEMRASAESTAADAAAEGGSSAGGAVQTASNALGAATIALVKAAAAAQTHLKSSTKGECYRKDPKWARGLVAAARVVADTTAQLNEVSAREDASPEEVVAAARCVNGATARLVAISRSKGDPELHTAVEKAAKGINAATNQVVNVAKAKKQAEKAQTAEQIVQELAKQGSRGAQIRAEFEAQAKIAKLENDLDDARHMLFTLRRAVYGGKSE